MWAAQNGQEATAQRLLGEIADDQARSDCYRKPLCVAAEKGYRGIVKLLLNKGADVNAQCKYYLPKLDQFYDSNALYAASEGGHEQIVKLLLDKGADVSARCKYYNHNRQQFYDSNALYAASEGGHMQVVELLLDKVVDVNVQIGYDGNALQAALSKNHEQVAKLLQEKGADIKFRDEFHGDRLHAAVAEHHEQIAKLLLKLLLKKGGNVKLLGLLYANARQEASYANALQAASDRCHGLVATLLIDKDADGNA